jgi:hypothetical protein
MEDGRCGYFGWRGEVRLEGEGYKEWGYKVDGKRKTVKGGCWRVEGGK